MSHDIKNIMKIERNPSTAPLATLTEIKKPAQSAAKPTVSGFEESQRLTQTLSSLPASRTEQVARAKALIADPNYPSNDQLAKIADHLAANW